MTIEIAIFMSALPKEVGLKPLPRGQESHDDRSEGEPLSPPSLQHVHTLRGNCPPSRSCERANAAQRSLAYRERQLIGVGRNKRLSRFSYRCALFAFGPGSELLMSALGRKQTF